MKVQLLNLGRILLMILFFLVSGWNVVNAISIQVKTSGPGFMPGEVEFTLEDIPELSGSNSKRHYSILWVFGDGTYEIDSIWHDEFTGPLLDKNKRHIYEVSSSFVLPTGPSDIEVRVELTKVYTPPDDDEILYASRRVNINPITVPLVNNHNLHGELARIDRSRNPKEEAGTTYMISYAMDTIRFPNGGGCGLANQGGTMAITYGDGLVLDQSYLDGSIDETIESYHGEMITSPYPNQIEIVIPANSSSLGSQREIILNFFTPELPINSMGDVSRSFVRIELEDAQNENCLDDILFDPVYFLKKGDPYDPNFKIVSIDTTTTNPEQVLRYAIQCQNVGINSTDTVKIIDQLDYRLNPSSINVLAVRMGYEEILDPDSLDTSSPIPLHSYPSEPFTFQYRMKRNGHEITWLLFQEGKLRGTNEPGFGEEFATRETIAQIEYEIETYCFEETNLAISNQASVYFDTLAPVETNTALTHKVCCQETFPDSVDFFSIDLATYLDSPAVISSIDSVAILSLSSDGLPPAMRPVVSIVNLEVEYSKVGFTGMDIIEVAVCDPNGTCDTLRVGICVGINPEQYECDTRKCAFGVGIQDDIQLDSKIFSIGPNPFNTSLHIYPNTPSEPIRLAELYNLQGIRVLNQEFNSREAVELQTPNLPSGVYLLRINQKKTFKVIKQ